MNNLEGIVVNQQTFNLTFIKGLTMTVHFTVMKLLWQVE